MINLKPYATQTTQHKIKCTVYIVNSKSWLLIKRQHWYFRIFLLFYKKCKFQGSDRGSVCSSHVMFSSCLHQVYFSQLSYVIIESEINLSLCCVVQ